MKKYLRIEDAPRTNLSPAELVAKLKAEGRIDTLREIKAKRLAAQQYKRDELKRTRGLNAKSKRLAKKYRSMRNREEYLQAKIAPAVEHKGVRHVRVVDGAVVGDPRKLSAAAQARLRAFRMNNEYDALFNVAMQKAKQ
jgi:hypothetical protein